MKAIKGTTVSDCKNMMRLTSKDSYNRYNSLLEDIIMELNKFTEGKRIDFGDNGFEDVSKNDLCGIDDNYVYLNNFEDNYSLYELDALDAIKILGDLET